MQPNDSDVLAQGALENDNPYHRILHILHQHEDEVLEIEILGMGTPFTEGDIVQDALCLGITKLALIKAFLEARGRFTTREDPSTKIEDILNSTKIILLFDPEHLTAANFRKRHLARLRNDAAQAGQLQKAVQHELNFLNTILTSPLHRQSKSPTLWYHRFWLMRSFVVPTDMGGTRTPSVGFGDILDQEISAVLKSAVRHPLNYHAWLYLRRLLIFIRDHQSGPERRSQLKSLLDRTTKWALRHPSDVSGWSFLSFALRLGDPAAESTSKAIADVKGFSEKLQWKGEGLSSFLKQAEHSRRAAFAMDVRWKDCPGTPT